MQAVGLCLPAAMLMPSAMHVAGTCGVHSRPVRLTVLLLERCRRGMLAPNQTVMLSTLCSGIVPPICVLPVSNRSATWQSAKSYSRFRGLAFQMHWSFVGHSSKLGRPFATDSRDSDKNEKGEMEEAQKRSLRKTDLHIVLVSPQIPGNTGCIARSCAAAAVSLHLVEPLGFEISSSKLKRAGLDYWPYVVVKVHKSWIKFFEYFQDQEGEKRLLGFTKKGKLQHTAVRYKRGDWLLFGSETDGLPEAAVQECLDDRHGGGLVRIPIDETYVRCLNLSVAAGIGIYEALRQVGYSESMNGSGTEDPIFGEREDIFC